MNSLILSLVLTSGSPLAHAGPASEPVHCKKQDGNLCYRIEGLVRSRIDRSEPFQKALSAVAQKMQGKSVVYIVQGYRSPAEQRILVANHCRAGASSCNGYASAETSRHVISIAADPMLYGNQIKAICYAENQARVEFLGPRSAAAVYGYDSKTNLTWAHIDDSTNSNYTPGNCSRNEGLNGNEKVAAVSGAPVSARVEEYKKQHAARDLASVTQAPPPSEVGGICGYYAILDCSKTAAGASLAMTQIGAGLQVVHTDDVNGFAPGWYCVTGGRSTKDAANSTVQFFRAKTSGYVKRGC